MNLTKREAEIVQRTALGATTDEIAAEFGRSVETVRTQIKLAREKLGARNVAHLVAISISKGFIQALCTVLCLALLADIDDDGYRQRTQKRMTRRAQVTAIYA